MKAHLNNRHYETKAASLFGISMVGAMVASMVNVDLAWTIKVGGIIDTHNHGGFGVLVNDGCKKEDMEIDVMSGLHHRDIGAFCACLMDESVYCELICDGMHICNEMLNIILKLKDHQHIMMVSDNVQYANVPASFYKREEGEPESDRSIIEVKEDGRILSRSGRLSRSGKSVL